MADNCPLSTCKEPWSEHDGIARIVHSEKATVEDAKTTFGFNGGVPCDTKRGPCDCGAWH